MKEQSKGEGVPSPEKIEDEDKKYNLLKEAEDKVSRLTDQIHELEMKADENLPKEEYERIIEERNKLAALLDKAMEEEKNAWQAWMAEIDKEQKEYEEKI